MPGLRARPGIGATVPILEFLKLDFVSNRLSLGFRCARLTRGGCGSLWYDCGSPPASLARECSAKAEAVRRFPGALGGNIRLGGSRSLWTAPSGSRSREGGASVRSQAQEDVERVTAKSYKTLAEPCRSTLEVKKSKFIAVGAPVDDETAAFAFLSQVRDTSASHNCWAFKIGERTRFSDDGEPGGTAGRPMLAAITSSGIDHVMVVVTRFFGGTKLGTGGLVRAYGTVTTDCLKGAETIDVKAKVSLKIRAPYDVLGVLYPLTIARILQNDQQCEVALFLQLQKYDVQKLDEIFDTEGEGGVTMDLVVDVENLPYFERELELTTKGRASVSHEQQCL